MPRDFIGSSEFTPATFQGLLAFAGTVGCEGLIEYGSGPEHWAWIWFLARQADDKPEWFPHGKWATLQRLEQMLNECAGGKKE